MPPHQKFKKSTKKEPPCLKTHLYSYYLSAETSCQNPENKKKRINRPKTRYIGVFVTFNNHHYTIRCRYIDRLQLKQPKNTENYSLILLYV